MDRWVLKDGQICFKDENAELNNWDLKSVVSCLNTRDDKIADLETKLAEKEKEVETTRKVFADGIVNQFRIIRLRNQRIIDELEDVKNEFCKPHLNGNGQKTFSVNKLERVINSKIKRLNQQIKGLKGDE